MIQSEKTNSFPRLFQLNALLKFMKKAVLAKKRLELELEKATEPEKANIKNALELIDSE